MSLTAAMQIGRSALTASQLGLQVAGNNMANVATPGYSRQSARLVGIRGDGSALGQSIGRGVEVRAVQRQIDGALQARLWGGTSDEAAAGAQSRIYGQIEDTLGELGDNDLSSQLSGFFKVWSERGNATKSSGSVVEQGDRLAGFIRGLRGQLNDQRKQIDGELAAGVTRANQLLSEIADLNGSVSAAEVAGGVANTLRDQRDASISALSALLDVTVIDRGSAGVDVLSGSTPVVLGGQARGLELRREVVNGVTEVAVATITDGQELAPGSGAIGALLGTRGQAVTATIGRLDSIASQLIFEVNKLHSTGTNATGLGSTRSQVRFDPASRGLALNDPANGAMAGLPFAAVNGGFTVSVRQAGTGMVQSVRIPVDLDGVTSAGTPGTADDATAEGIRAALAGVPGLSATWGADGSLRIEAADGFDFRFEDDSAGVLGALGVNAYFTGSDGSDMGVREDLKGNPEGLMSGRMVGGQFVENGTALLVAGLQGRSLPGLLGLTVQDSWREAVQSVGADAAGARVNAEATSVVRESLESQRAAISGVSIDEESLNLLDFQRQYQGAAKLISVANEMTQTLLQLV